MRSTLAGKKFQIGLTTVVFLVALRIMIGSMFYWGAIHKRDSDFSSAGFMQRATGPLASLYHSQVPDYYGWRDTIETPRLAEPTQAAREVDRLDRTSEAWRAARDQLLLDKSEAYKDWQEQVVDGWWASYRRVAQHFGFDKKQEEAANKKTEVYVARLNDYLVQAADDLIAYRHNLYQNKHAEPGPELPASAEANKIWQAALKVREWAKTSEKDMIGELSRLATKEQAELGALPPVTDSIVTLDKIVIYSHLAIGACLILGLFTRVAFFGAGTFILTVVATQPPWAADAAPWLWGPQAVGYQASIMLICFALAFSHVGRWGGLDFFVHKLIGRRCCGSKGDA